jgi:signal transduction histidine kinase
VTIGSTLSLRIAAILLVGFVLLQTMIWLVVALPSRSTDEQPYNLPAPAQLRVMTRLIEATPTDRRDALIGLFNGSLYTVRVQRTAPPARLSRDDDLDVLERQYEAALPGRAIDITGRRPLLGRMVGARPWPGRLFAPITVSIPLRSGGILVVNSRPSAVVRTYLRQRAFLGAIGGIAVLVILLFAVRQTTRPLIALSQGVRRFSDDLAMSDLPVSGPREIRALSIAFNDMKARIGALMGERTRMLAGIAHDMRTYLTRLRLRVEFIDDPAQRAKAAADLDEMAMLLDDTLLFAHRDSDAAPRPTRIDIAEELRTIVDMRREMGDAVKLDPVPPCAVSADPIAFRRMLSNLIDNAIRHGGSVEIAVREEPDGIVIAVADDGPGVPPHELTRLGEPFGRLDPSRDRETGGAGLGLAIVRALASRENATVQFANRPEGGFVVTLRFPA